MAKKTHFGSDADNTQAYTIIRLTKAEVVEMVALLTAQLVDMPSPGSCAGAVPILTIRENGKVIERMSFFVSED